VGEKEKPFRRDTLKTAREEGRIVDRKKGERTTGELAEFDNRARDECNYRDCIPHSLKCASGGRMSIQEIHSLARKGAVQFMRLRCNFKRKELVITCTSAWMTIPGRGTMRGGVLRGVGGVWGGTGGGGRGGVGAGGGGWGGGGGGGGVVGGGGGGGGGGGARSCAVLEWLTKRTARCRDKGGGKACVG